MNAVPADVAVLVDAASVLRGVRYCFVRARSRRMWRQEGEERKAEDSRDLHQVDVPPSPSVGDGWSSRRKCQEESVLGGKLPLHPVGTGAPIAAPQCGGCCRTADVTPMMCR
jgi:hypothetical protein